MKENDEMFLRVKRAALRLARCYDGLKIGEAVRRLNRVFPSVSFEIGGDVFVWFVLRGETRFVKVGREDNGVFRFEEEDEFSLKR